MDLYAILLAPPKQTNSTPTTSHWAASPTSMETAIGQLQLSSQSAGNMTPRIFGSCCSHQWTFLFAFRGSSFDLVGLVFRSWLFWERQNSGSRVKSHGIAFCLYHLIAGSCGWYLYICVCIYIYTHYIQVYIYIYILSYIHRYGSIASLVEPQISWHHKGKSKPRPPHISHNSHNQAFVDRVVL